MPTTSWPLPYLLELQGQRISPRSLPFDTMTLNWDFQYSLAEKVKSKIAVYSQARAADDVADFLECECVYVVSDALKCIFERTARNIEFFPASVELTKPSRDTTVWGGGPVLENYWLMNSWNRLELVDWDRSVYTPVAPDDLKYFPGHYPRALAWKKLVLKNLPQDEHLFGLQGLGGEGQGRRFLSRALALQALDSGLRIQISQHRITPGYEWQSNIRPDLV